MNVEPGEIIEVWWGGRGKKQPAKVVAVHGSSHTIRVRLIDKSDPTTEDNGPVFWMNEERIVSQEERPERDGPGYWWASKCCGALCHPDMSACWNCHMEETKHLAVAVVEDRCEAEGCKLGTYLSLQLPEHGIDTPCPYYLQHNGMNAYYPPNIPAAYWLEVNALRWDEEVSDVVAV